jgi:hypothetical protein
MQKQVKRAHEQDVTTSLLLRRQCAYTTIYNVLAYERKYILRIRYFSRISTTG